MKNLLRLLSRKINITGTKRGVVIRNSAIKPRTPNLESVSFYKSITSYRLLYSSDQDNLEVKGLSGSLYEIVDKCFSEHWSLSLTPDVIWFVILEQVTQYIKENPEKHREWFTDSKEEKEIEVLDNLSNFDIYTKEDWHNILPSFKKSVAKEIGYEKMNFLLPQFSFLKQESEMALIIAMMDAVSVYYTFSMTTLCGIPKIRLQGDRQDWVNIKLAIDGLHILDGLKLYFDKLNTILDKFINAFDGRIDRKFFNSIYKRNNESGGPYITGWFADLFAYSKEQLKGKDDYIPWFSDAEGFNIGTCYQNFPCNISKAKFKWNFTAGKSYYMSLFGGIFQAEQKGEFLEPVLDYAVGVKK